MSTTHSRAPQEDVPLSISLRRSRPALEVYVFSTPESPDSEYESESDDPEEYAEDDEEEEEDQLAITVCSYRLECPRLY